MPGKPAQHPALSEAAQYARQRRSVHPQKQRQFLLCHFRGEFFLPSVTIGKFKNNPAHLRHGIGKGGFRQSLRMNDHVHAQRMHQIDHQVGILRGKGFIRKQRRVEQGHFGILRTGHQRVVLIAHKNGRHVHERIRSGVQNSAFLTVPADIGKPYLAGNDIIKAGS